MKGRLSVAWAAALVASGSAGAARGDVSSAVAAGVAGGATAAAVTSAGQHDRALLVAPVVGRELYDWADPRTGATARLAEACDHTIELRLSGNASFNYLNVAMSNHSEGDTALDPRGVVAHFENGITRRLLGNERGDDVLPKGWWGQHALQFPSKEDFKDQNRLVVDLPIVLGAGGQCVASVMFQRSTELPHDSRTHVPYAQYELYFGAGPQFAGGGGLRDLGGGSGAMVDFGFAYWPLVNHGWFMEGSLDYYGSKGVPLVSSRVLDNPRITGVGFFVGYSVRAYITRWLAVSYGLGAAPYALELEDNDKSHGSYLSRGFLALRERATLTFTLARISDGTQFAIAPVFSHTAIPFGSFGPADATGHALSGMLRLYIGG